MGASDWRGKTHLDTMAAGAEGAGVAREVRREGGFYIFTIIINCTHQIITITMPPTSIP